jgi:aminopeptidase N
MNLDFSNFSGETITANCRVKFQSEMNNVNSISLDLLQFTIDSVRSAGNTLNYTYNDTLMVVDLNATLSLGGIDSVTVYYSGQPQLDPSGFGGFYFQGDYAYNLGVGFQADPHNYGRTWHPCFDNFVERATYDITVVSPSDKYAYSNGYIAEEYIDVNGSNVRRWILEESIPTYLACVGVAPYTHVDQTYVSSLTSNQTPVMLIAAPQDTSNMKASFANLFGAMDAFESNYGPYEWNKIAFALVPFNGGAMEHATCVMYPRVTANGNLQYETLMAHELSHHWWGNLVTCMTSGDMWINEGLATYSESIFLEHVYDYDRYISELKGIHRDVIQTAHISDGAFYALSGVPHSATYGDHSYQKGATMMHNLRTYMGDVSFFDGLKYIQTNFAFDNIDALGFKNALEASSGQDLDPFFDGYVLNPGFNGYELDSFAIEPVGNEYEVTVYVEQKRFESPDFFNNIPLEVTFTGAGWQRETSQFVMSGATGSSSFTVPFYPEMIALNEGNKLLNAVTGENIVVTEPSMENLDYPYFFLNILDEDDSSFVRLEHYRLAPDPINSAFIGNQFVISPERFWKVDGIWSDSFNAEAWLVYDGRETNAGYLDTALMTSHNGVAFHEDSVVLLWRPNQSVRWEEYPFYDRNTYSSKTDGFGRIETTTLLKGEYTFGFRKNIAKVLEQDTKQFNIYPNPTSEDLTVSFDGNESDFELKIYDSKGKLWLTQNGIGSKAKVSTQELKIGNYFITIELNNQLVGTQEFIKQ